MSKATYWQRGESLDYKNNGNTVIEAGTILVIGTRLGIAGCDIAPGALGSVHVEGVYKLPKGSTALALGANVTYDATSGKVAQSGGSDAVHGFVVEAATADADSVYVKINA